MVIQRHSTPKAQDSIVITRELKMQIPQEMRDLLPLATALPPARSFSLDPSRPHPPTNLRRVLVSNSGAWTPAGDSFIIKYCQITLVQADLFFFPIIVAAEGLLTSTSHFNSSDPTCGAAAMTSRACPEGQTATDKDFPKVFVSTSAR